MSCIFINIILFSNQNLCLFVNFLALTPAKPRARALFKVSNEQLPRQGLLGFRIPGISPCGLWLNNRDSDLFLYVSCWCLASTIISLLLLNIIIISSSSSRSLYILLNVYSYTILCHISIISVCSCIVVYLSDYLRPGILGIVLFVLVAKLENGDWPRLGPEMPVYRGSHKSTVLNVVKPPALAKCNKYLSIIYYIWYLNILKYLDDWEGFLSILIAIVLQNDIELPLMVSRFFAAGISTILIIGYC